MSHTYEYARPSLTVDVVLFRWHAGWLEILLIERAHDPFAGRLALPGGFVDAGETPADAARRELMEETGVPIEALVACGTFGDPGRDPRGWVVSAAYLGFAPPNTQAIAGSDARKVGWYRVGAITEMAFDHAQILATAMERLRETTQTGTLPLQLLPPGFRTRQARFLYSQIWGESLPPQRFKAWLRRRDVVERVGPAKFARRPGLRADWCR